MRKLVIGCGYLGERVAREWLRNGEQASALTRSQENALQLRCLGIEPIVGDVLNPESLRALPDSDTVLYAVGFDRTQGRDKRDVYVTGLGNVLREIAHRTQRLIYVSSTSVYGQDDGEWVDEDSPTEPSDENGRICRDAEACLVGQQPRANILRLAGIYGPGRLLARVDQLRQGLSLSVNPDGWLNLIHVDDAVQAVLATELRGVGGRTYLVCDDTPLRRRDFYTALAKFANAPPPQFPSFDEASPEAKRLNKRCCNRRLRDELRVSLTFPSAIDGLGCLFAERQ